MCKSGTDRRGFIQNPRPSFRSGLSCFWAVGWVWVHDFWLKTVVLGQFGWVWVHDFWLKTAVFEQFGQPNAFKLSLSLNHLWWIVHGSSDSSQLRYITNYTVYCITNYTVSRQYPRIKYIRIKHDRINCIRIKWNRIKRSRIKCNRIKYLSG